MDTKDTNEEQKKQETQKMFGFPLSMSMDCLLVFLSDLSSRGVFDPLPFENNALFGMIMRTRIRFGKLHKVVQRL